MQSQLAETDVLGDMKKFQVQSHAPGGAELTIDQCLTALKKKGMYVSREKSI